ncbi:MAG: potassium transporter TrkG [Thermomicrobiales bacterium]
MRLPLGAPRHIRVQLSRRFAWRLRAAPLRRPLLLVAGFALLIAIGTLALLLPFSARNTHSDPLTALFTATSAVCVTGMVVVDTGTYWSPFGQVVIAALMQVGGLGFMIGVTALRALFGRRPNLRERLVLQETGAITGLAGGRALILQTVALALACETIGALILWIRLTPRYGVGEGLWFAIFHAVSAFTNGSFDLFGSFRSLSDYQHDPALLLTIAALIALGGLSVVTMLDLARVRGWRRLTLDSKVVLLGTAILLVGGTALLLLTESGNDASFGTLPLVDRVVNALFHATASRTAGFATWDLARADERSLFFLLGLMFLGGAPGSMAGGIKLTTVAVLIAAVMSTLRGQPDATLLKRRIAGPQVGQALAVTLLAFLLIVNVALAISLIEGRRLGIPFLHVLFDVTSAFGTVGFSTGLPPQAHAATKLLLVAMMFVGRLGPVTVALALTARRSDERYRLPVEPMRIG